MGDVHLFRGLLALRRQTCPGCGGLVTKETKGRRRRPVPNDRAAARNAGATDGGQGQGRCPLVGPRGAVITTATLRAATGWNELVHDFGLAGLVRHWLATYSAHVDGRRACRVAPSPASGRPSRAGRDEPLSPPRSPGRARCRGGVLALVGRKWAQLPGAEAGRGWAGGRMHAALIRCDNRIDLSGWRDLNRDPLTPRSGRHGCRA